ncbi:molybdate ABC transporter substrate-binding protein [Oceaniglobus indicus]|uniref:molybdate ABC transporter substrate-binding protein n=1 Tax=Oceaniglobus indicus TaxID=2047749 RepID=UPI000C1A2672|nr:molybdate ABC transporter substrate-binding protein [Oceaniglobus indicus]
MLRAVTLCLFLFPTLAVADVTIFAAASLKTALDEIAAGVDDPVLTISYAGSSTLARQIEQGAPADIFISANTDWMNRLESTGLIVPGTRTDLLGNSLVLISHQPRTLDLTADPDLAGALNGGRLAMALVNAVPAGIYGKAALTSLGLWEDVAPSVAQADNVRAALALVALGEAPLGVVYATDANAELRVHVTATFPADSHAPIVYPLAAIRRNDEIDTALEILQGPAAAAIFEAQGFTVLRGPE